MVGDTSPFLDSSFFSWTRGCWLGKLTALPCESVPCDRTMLWRCVNKIMYLANNHWCLSDLLILGYDVSLLFDLEKLPQDGKGILFMFIKYRLETPVHTKTKHSRCNQWTCILCYLLNSLHVLHTFLRFLSIARYFIYVLRAIILYISHFKS